MSRISIHLLRDSRQKYKSQGHEGDLEVLGPYHHSTCEKGFLCVGYMGRGEGNVGAGLTHTHRCSSELPGAWC